MCTCYQIIDNILMLHVALKRLISHSGCPSAKSSSSHTDLIILTRPTAHYSPTSVVPGERGFMHRELLRVFFQISLLSRSVPAGSVNIKITEVMLTMVELTSRNDHINQIWTRMYLTLYQTFITLLLFFSRKQTWLCIQIMPVSFPSQHLLFYFIAAQCTIKAGHSAV